MHQTLFLTAAMKELACDTWLAKYAMLTNNKQVYLAPASSTQSVPANFTSTITFDIRTTTLCSLAHRQLTESPANRAAWTGNWAHLASIV